jgi:ABC-2 type transport system permease protein
MKTLMPLMRKELAEDLMATRGLIFLVITSVVLSTFSILLISNTELSLLDNAQAVYLMAGIALALAALVAVMRGSDGFAGERERSTLEALLLTPHAGPALAAAKMAGIVFSWFLLLVIAIPYIWTVGRSGQNLGAALQYLLITGTLLVLFFGGLTLALSARMKSLKGVLSIGLSLLLLSGSPLVLGPSLRQSLAGRIIDLLNPFADALNILDSTIVDSQGLTWQLLRLTVMVGYAAAALMVLYLACRRIDP